MEDCDGTAVLPHHHFHLEFKHDPHSGLLDSMRIKDGHTFDVNRLKLRINPIVCFTGLTTMHYKFHYENTPMQHTAIFHASKNDNFQ